MTLFDIIAVLITLTALLSYVNARTARLPTPIGVTLGGLITSLLLLGLGWAGFGIDLLAERTLARIDFDALLMQGLLSFFLFAGSLHINLNDLLKEKWTIGVMAVFGTLFSTVLVGVAMRWMFGLLGLSVPLPYALLFGALISPTDPVAVLALLRRAGTPLSLETLIVGESLFNDGVGVVVFTILAGLIASGGEVSTLEAGRLFAEEAAGGVVYGLFLGGIAYQMLRRVDNYTVEILITLAVVTGGYALAGALHTSGPLAMVVAGLLIGNQGRRFGMSEQTRTHLDTFWLVVDETLNAVLFVLIGLELLVVEWRGEYLLAGLVAIPVVLGARLLSVGGPILLLGLRRDFIPHTIQMMTWGGLRGGIAIALALSLPASAQRELLVVVTYVVVVFSILVQGLTVEPLARRVAPAGEKPRT